VELTGKLSGYTDYSLFYAVPAEANENLKWLFIRINPELSLFTMLFMDVLLQL
jgi:hypothetical protein